MKKNKLFASASREFLANPIVRLRDLTEAATDIKDILSFIVSGVAAVTAFTAGGIQQSGVSAGGLLGPLLEIFALRMLIFIGMAAAFGWTFAAVVTWFSSRASEMSRIIGFLFGVGWAAMLVALADGLFSFEEYATSVYLGFCALGLCIALILAMSKLRSLRTPDMRDLAYQSGVIALFVVSVACVAPLSMLV